MMISNYYKYTTIVTTTINTIEITKYNIKPITTATADTVMEKNGKLSTTATSINTGKDSK